MNTIMKNSLSYQLGVDLAASNSEQQKRIVVDVFANLIPKITMRKTGRTRNGKPVYCIHGFTVSWERATRPQAAGICTPSKKYWGWKIISRRFFNLYPNNQPPRFGWEKIEGVRDYIEVAIAHGERE